MTNKKTSSAMVMLLLAFGFLLGGCASLSGETLTTANDANKSAVSEGKGPHGNAPDYTTEETPLSLPATEMLKLPGLDKTTFGYALPGQLWYLTNPPTELDLSSALQMLKLLEGKPFPKEFTILPPNYKPFIPDMRSSFDANAAREQQLKGLERSLHENVDVERFLKNLERDRQEMRQNLLTGLESYLKQNPSKFSK